MYHWNSIKYNCNQTEIDNLTTKLRERSQDTDQLCNIVAAKSYLTKTCKAEEMNTISNNKKTHAIIDNENYVEGDTELTNTERLHKAIEDTTLSIFCKYANLLFFINKNWPGRSNPKSALLESRIFLPNE